MHAVKGQGHTAGSTINWFTYFTLIGPTIPEIQQFQNLTLKWTILTKTGTGGGTVGGVQTGTKHKVVSGKPGWLYKKQCANLHWT